MVVASSLTRPAMRGYFSVMNSCCVLKLILVLPDPRSWRGGQRLLTRKERSRDSQTVCKFPEQSIVGDETKNEARKGGGGEGS